MRKLENEHYVDITEQSPLIISFCPGIRGLERGLERVFHSVRVAAFVEIETFIVENLLASMEEGVVAPAPIWSNLKTFNPKPFRGRIAGIIGGYPCQPFSHAGNRLGTEDPRHLWPFIRQHIEVIQPGWCFFENVAGHLSLGFDVVKRELEEMDYFVEAGIYSAEEIGAPHKRERLFILAIRMGHSSDINKRNERSSEPNERLPSGRSGVKLEHADNGHTTRDTGEHEGQSEEKRIRQRDNTPKSCEPSSVPETVANANSRRREEPKQETEPLHELGSEHSELAHTRSARNETGIPRQEQRNEGSAGIFNDCSPEHRFPAGQGVYQHPWEEPRTIESCMEYTINGYNFTEDLHRAIGNSVVEQTAEFAFRDLTAKIYEWFKYING